MGVKIPEGWVKSTIGEILTSGQLGSNYPNALEYSDAPVIKMGNLGRGKINLEKIEYLPSPVKPNELDRLHTGDILFNTRNTPELVGKVAVWRDELPVAYFNSNLMRLRFDDKLIASNYFANYLFNSVEMISRLSNIATGTTSVAAIYSRDLKKIEVLLPRLSEQLAIVKAMSDIDGLIENFKSEILKKQNILKGFMQSLVVGDYFRENSITFEIEQIQNLPIEIQRGQLITGTTKVEGNIPVIAGGISAAYFNNIANRFGTTITISASGANAGFVNLWRSDIWASDCSTIGESEVYEVLYIFYVLKEKQKVLFDAQYGGGQPHIRPKEIGEISIPWISKANQKDLVVILEGLSKEIETLEIELAKYECIKQGMAHVLLTGKVRLV